MNVRAFRALTLTLTLAATCRAGAHAAAAFAGCAVFPGDSGYSRKVAADPIDPHSAQYIATMMNAGGGGGFWTAALPVEYVNVATSATPLLSVRQKVRYHHFDAAYPWSSTFKIEPESDAHAMVVSVPSCRLYETYDTSFTAGVLAAYSGAVWDLRRPFRPLPVGTPSAMASGLSLFAGTIRWDEVQSGRVEHALNWAAAAGSVSQFEFVRPASDTDWIPFKGTGLYRLPYGARLRLKRSFDISTFGPQSRAIAQALKTYGMYLADTASDGNALYDAMPAGGLNGWSAADLAALGRIHLSDFDVLKLPPVLRVPGH